MKKTKILAGAVSLILVLTLCVYAFSPSASAIINKNGSITLHIADSKTKVPLEGADFRLYFFAAAYEKNHGVGYDYVIPYDNCKMDMGNLQDAYLPIHLTHFAYTYDLPFTVKSSDINGEIIFDGLTPGVYLIVPSENIPEYFMPSPFVINIPLYDKENKDWIYDINATPKMQIYGAQGTEDSIYISVKKQWNSEGEHPDSVSVSLLCDFREIEKITLNESNGWHYRWDKLSNRHSWSVVESEVPDGYTVSYEVSANTVTIINGKNPSQEGIPPTSDPGKEPVTKPEELIHTGQLNWPIPVFTIAGLILFSLGWAMLNFGKKDGEEV
ncbi:MAG: Cna B-type domain-containing protein [Clostridia bacterium]|nr:Cna B-type domain-containing protein [Clostridia bacterium]